MGGHGESWVFESGPGQVVGFGRAIQDQPSVTAGRRSPTKGYPYEKPDSGSPGKGNYSQAMGRAGIDRRIADSTPLRKVVGTELLFISHAFSIASRYGERSRTGRAEYWLDVRIAWAHVHQVT